MQHGVDGTPFIERLDDKLVKEFGQLTDKGFFRSFDDLTDAKRGEYWKIKSDISVSGIKLNSQNAILCNIDFPGTPTDLSNFRIVTTDPLGKLRISVSHDFGVTFPDVEDIDLYAKAKYEEPFYVTRNPLGSSAAWTFKFEIFSKQPIAVIEAKAWVGS